MEHPDKQNGGRSDHHEEVHQAIDIAVSNREGTDTVLCSIDTGRNS